MEPIWNTVFFTGHMEEVIEQFSSLRDLRIIMTDDGKFQDHIEKVVKKSLPKDRVDSKKFSHQKN